MSEERGNLHNNSMNIPHHHIGNIKCVCFQYVRGEGSLFQQRHRSGIEKKIFPKLNFCLLCG